jgi:hypothetical protein
MHPYDLYFYDPDLQQYTVQRYGFPVMSLVVIKHFYTMWLPSRYLDDVKARYGGVDSLLIWPTYTNLGCDDRNQVRPAFCWFFMLCGLYCVVLPQYDMIRALPGHIEGLLNITQQLHGAGVRVLWPYNPWDQGTRYEGTDDAHAVPKLLTQCVSWPGFCPEVRCCDMCLLQDQW